MPSQQRSVFFIVILLFLVNVSPLFAQGTAMTSDDFNRFRLDDDVWTVVNPSQTATVRLVGTNSPDAWLEIDIPAGVNQDIWFDGLNAPRVMQRARNVDFQAEVRFESSLTTQGQSQGIFIYQDDGNYLQAYFTALQGQTVVMAAGATNYQLNLNTPYLNTPVAPLDLGPLWLRVTRVQNEWTVSYSLDGQTFTDLPAFSHRIAVAQIGVYGGVFNFLSDAPSFKMVADYFLNLAAPFPSEDGATVEDVFPPLIVSSEWVPFDNRVSLSWLTDESANVVVDYGLTTEFELGSIVLTDLTSARTVEIPDLTPNTDYNVRLTLTDVLGNEVLTEPFTIRTLAAPPTSPVIQMWYGDVQRFGGLGIAQRWVNLLGTVVDADAEDIITMSYSLNDGEEVPLKVGPDRRRLAGTGDFNVELPIEGLVEGENSVFIRASDRYGNRANVTVSVVFSNFNVWGIPYSIDWTQTQNIQTAVQVVDGKWELTGSGLRIVEPGYRRMVSIGDISWTDYELLTQFTINAILPPAGNPARTPEPEPYIGAIARWTGYFDWDGSRPALGPLPVGAFGRYIWRTAVGQAGVQDNLELLDGVLNPTVQDKSGTLLAPNRSYLMRMRVVSAVDGSSFYAVRVWAAESQEQTWWNIATTVPEGGNLAGSVALVANRVDVTFTDVQVGRLTPDAYLVQTYDNTPPECPVTVVAAGANLRLNAGPDFGLVRSVPGGAPLFINGQRQGPDGAVWYRVVEDSAWLRADLVTLSPDCDPAAIISLDETAP